MTTTPTPMIEADRVTHRWGKKAVLGDATLSLSSGEAGAILGRSGSGKTTLMMLIGGLIPLQSGRIITAGLDIAAASDARRAAMRRESVGFAFQNYLLDATATALQNIALPRLLAGRSVRQAYADAERALDRVGLGELAGQPVGKMSGGQRQRIAFARAIVGDPLLVLADEPTGNLDATTAGLILDVIAAMKRDLGTTFLIVTHDPIVDPVLDRAWLLADGRLVEQRAAAPELDAPELDDVPTI
jgi:ABC-type lipoprotein export system ATPase subunit